MHRPLLPLLPLRHLVRVRLGLRVEVRVEVREEARVAARARLARPRAVVRARRLERRRLRAPLLRGARQHGARAVAVVNLRARAPA